MRAFDVPRSGHAHRGHELSGRPPRRGWFAPYGWHGISSQLLKWCLRSILDRRFTASRAEASRLVLILAPQEVEEVNALVLAGLVDAQNDQIVAKGGFGEPPISELPVLGEALDGVLGVVVVPRDTVVIEEGEQLPPVLLKPLSVPLCDLGPSLARTYLVEERLRLRPVLVQVPLLQAVPVYGFDDLPEQGRKALRQRPELLVVGVLEQGAVAPIWRIMRLFPALAVLRVA